MANFITECGRLVTALFGANGWVSQIVGCVTTAGNEILYIGFIISVACLGIGVVKRLSKLG